jgi:fructosamine-3-kinase
MSRRDIYYWKCDRPSAFHGTQTQGSGNSQIAQQLEGELRRHFDTKNITLNAGPGQGNHLTWIAELAGMSLFVRVENGPDGDDHLAVESAVLDRVREAGVRTPRVLGCDATRSRVSFAWQALERIQAPDLNSWFKAGQLDVPQIAFEIGVAVARWQEIALEGFGVLDGQLRGYRPSYADYFRLRLEQHLHFLKSHGFLNDTAEIQSEMDQHRALLELDSGCLVHKDLALWNILGTQNQISAFIDFDDAISGDPMDDLSLLACFHDAAFLQRAFEGYQSLRHLPSEYRRRFWLHLLRNMIVKSVIRVGAGYFDRSDGFFLLGGGQSGANLKDTTLRRLAIALRGLREDAEVSIL